MQLSSRETKLAITAVYVAVCIVAWRIGIVPALDKLEHYRTSEEHAVRQWEKYSKILTVKDTIVKQYSAFREQLAGSLSAKEELSTMLTEVNEIATACNLRITDIKPGQIDEHPLYTSLTIRAEVEAELGPLSRFFYEVEQSARLLRVEFLRMRPKALNSKELKVEVLISRLAIP